VKVLLTGGNGFVAGSVIKQAPPDCELHVLSRQEAQVSGANMRWHTLAALDEEHIRQAFEESRPDAVLHLAALADIDYCQAHPEEARAVNTELTQTIATLCAARGCRMIHASTDTVFDGVKGMYVESEPPSPVNTYAETKAAAEKAVSSTVKDYVVARFSLVVGLPMLGRGNSFLARMIPTLQAGKELGVPDNEIRTPVDVVTLGRALLELAGSDFTGFIHLAGNDALNRWTMVRRIAVRLGLNENLVVPNNPAQIPGRAPRPPDVSLNNALARRVLKTPMLNLDQAVDLIMESR
jgi:dTDP-4-dehydrorhamnose reductase